MESKTKPTLDLDPEVFKNQTEVKWLGLLDQPEDHVEGALGAEQLRREVLFRTKGLSSCQPRLLKQLSQSNITKWDFTCVALVEKSKSS